MPTEEQLQGGFNLGEWEVLPDEGILRRGDQVERPEPQTWRVLLVLAKYDGKLVTRDNLVEEVWDGRAVADDPINRAIREVRKSLGDSAQSPLYVETLHRRGYRLKQSVELHNPPESEVAPIAGQEAGPSLRLWKLLAAFLTVILIAIIVYPRIFPPPVRSIAVLPFENLSGRPEDDAVAFGTKEIIVQTLHGIDGLTVINVRKTYDLEPWEIAEMFEVERVLLGYLQRVDDQVKINYTISKGKKGVVHSGDIEGPVGESFDLQIKLAKMARKDLVGRSRQELIGSRPSNSRAYDSYMRGRFELEHRGVPSNLEDAIALFESAIEQDESYGPSYLALATAYLLMVDYRGAPVEEMNRLAIETVEEGISFDSSIEDAAGTIYGFVYHRQKRWRESEEAHLRSINADFVDANAFNWYSKMLASVGRLNDALDLAQRGIRLEPSSGVLNSRLAIVYTWLGDSVSAYEYLRRSNDLGWAGERDLMANALLLTREEKNQEALDLTMAGAEKFGYSADWADSLFGAISDPSRVPEAMQALDIAAADEQIERFIEIIARALLGDIDGGMGVARLLEEHGEEFEMDILFIPELQAFRQHPEFMPLLERLGIVEYWKNNGCEWSDDRVTCAPNENKKH